MAAVRFVDGSGNVIAIDSRDLFDIKKGDVVVIRGRGEVQEGLNLLNVTADGIHVRR